MSSLNLSSMFVTGWKRISIVFHQNFTGRVKYDARLKDSAGAYSIQLNIVVYVLKNPCLSGHCEPNISCKDSHRVLSFDPYFCQCDLGYEGQWCQTQTDECQTAACNPIFDCVDLIAAYRCDVNPGKLAAIIICSLVGTVVLFAFCVVGRKYCRRNILG